MPAYKIGLMWKNNVTPCSLKFTLARGTLHCKKHIAGNLNLSKSQMVYRPGNCHQQYIAVDWRKNQKLQGFSNIFGWTSILETMFVPAILTGKISRTSRTATTIPLPTGSSLPCGLCWPPHWRKEKRVSPLQTTSGLPTVSELETPLEKAWADPWRSHMWIHSSCTMKIAETPELLSEGKTDDEEALKFHKNPLWSYLWHVPLVSLATFWCCFSQRYGQHRPELDNCGLWLNQRFQSLKTEKKCIRNLQVQRTYINLSGQSHTGESQANEEIDGRTAQERNLKPTVL